MDGRLGRLGAVSLGSVLVLVPLVAPAASAWHTDLPVVYEETGEGSVAIGLAGTLEEQADVGVGVTGYAPSQASQLSGGLVLFDQDREVRLMFAFAAHGSPDRTIVSPTPADPTPSGSWEEGGWTTQLVGDASLLAEHGIEVAILPGKEASPSSEDPLVYRIGVTSYDVDAGPLYRIAWLGEVGSHRLEVETDAGLADVDTTRGAPHVLGDPEIRDGGPNVQYQDSQALPWPVGVKVMRDASTSVDVEDRLYGFWALSDFKRACQFQVPACVFAGSLHGACEALVGANCGPGELSWQGPTGGGEGSTSYSLVGTPPGTYGFTVDHKIDVYGPSVYDRETGTLIGVGEHHSYLTLADVELPAG
jgi:hypothetical protein